MNTETKQERGEYRVVYPQSVRPQLRLASAALAVADVSEHGARLLDPDSANRRVGERCEGQMTLAHGPTVAIRGVVVRVYADGFALEFDEDAHIILPHIIGEQRHLRELFPDWR